MNPSGNTILITGGGSGIGRGLAEAFHALGNQIIISGRRRPVLDETTAANPGMKALEVDMRDPASIRAFAARALAEFPSINVLISHPRGSTFTITRSRRRPSSAGKWI